MVKIIEKAKIIHHLDKSIYGTLVKMDDIGSENGYVNIYYIPIKKGFTIFGGKGKVKVLRNIPKDCVHSVMSGSTEAGVEKDSLIIYTDEPDSVIKRIFENNLQRRIEEYKETIDSLKKQVSALRMEANDARSGVNKSIESMKQLSRAGRPEGSGVIIPPRRPYGYSDYNTDLDDEGY